MHNMLLPPSYEPYTDIYFLRSLEILQKMNVNPYVRAQIFIREGPGKICGMNETIEIIKTYSKVLENGGTISYLEEGKQYYSGETILVIEAKIQDIIPLETMILGVLSAEITKSNDKHDINLDRVTQRMKEIVSLTQGRPVFYFGARHWRYDMDEAIAKAAFKGGAINASTSIDAGTAGKKAIGTIPHSLENVFAWIYGADRAVVETTKIFDQIIDTSVPRVALVDYANREVDDSLTVARELQGNLTGIRVDTCGENVMQGAIEVGNHKNSEYWYGKGVTISGVYNLRKKLHGAGFDTLQIILSSGFGKPEKVKAFVDAEKELGIKLFDSLGVGNVFDSRIVTMDIVGVGASIERLKPIAKIGRKYRPNKRLISL